jgi:hypothetical protein
MRVSTSRILKVVRHELARATLKTKSMNTVIDGLIPRVAFKFIRLADALLIVFVQNLIAMMTGNTNYPTPTLALTAISTALASFITKVQEAMTGGVLATAARNSARRVLLALVRQLAAYVQLTANGDLNILLSSGFDAVKARSPVAAVRTPLNLRITQGEMSGELLLRFKRNGANSTSFSVQYAENPDGPWTDQPPITKGRTSIKGLTAGKMYWVRVRANGAGGSSEWTAPTCRMVI